MVFVSYYVGLNKKVKGFYLICLKIMLCIIILVINFYRLSLQMETPPPTGAAAVYQRKIWHEVHLLFKPTENRLFLEHIDSAQIQSGCLRFEADRKNTQ